MSDDKQSVARPDPGEVHDTLVRAEAYLLEHAKWCLETEASLALAATATALAMLTTVLDAKDKDGQNPASQADRKRALATVSATLDAIRRR